MANLGGKTEKKGRDLYGKVQQKLWHQNEKRTSRNIAIPVKGKVEKDQKVFSSHLRGLIDVKGGGCRRH